MRSAFGCDAQQQTARQQTAQQQTAQQQTAGQQAARQQIRESLRNRPPDCQTHGACSNAAGRALAARAPPGLLRICGRSAPWRGDDTVTMRVRLVCSGLRIAGAQAVLLQPTRKTRAGFSRHTCIQRTSTWRARGSVDVQRSSRAAPALASPLGPLPARDTASDAHCGRKQSRAARI